jgi:Relaxase/Mobilisation nuclease domain
VIAKVSRARDPGAMVRYVFGPGRAEEHLSPRVIAGNIAAADERAVREGLGAQAQLRADLGRPSYHVALAAAPEDRRMDDAEWARISERFAEEMGLESCAWVTVRHDDVQRDGREHVHLLAVAVTGAGERWDDSLDRPRAIKVCRAIEAERGLVVADAPERRAGRDARTAQAARYAAAREDAVPDQQRARAGLERAVDRSDGTWPDLMGQAGREGLRLALRERSGGVTGVSVTVDRADGQGERTFRASALHRSLSAAQITQRLGARREQLRTPEPARTRPAQTALAAHDIGRAELERARAALPIAQLDRLDELATRRQALQQTVTTVGEQLAGLPPAPRWRADRHAPDREQLIRGLDDAHAALAAVDAEHHQLAEQLHDLNPAQVRHQHATLTRQLAEHQQQRDALEAAALVAAASPSPGHQRPPGSSNARDNRATPTRPPCQPGREPGRGRGR